ncbi:MULTISPECIES: GNAT family N-acetyltransferase [unclassified Sphingobium]|uniref:GNAT family N-acetyltransferase n=1 Tax=unclassified Sphingobium TaxID=2611147 RepID=UPI00077018B8|nr:MULTISPECIES: GNAT family N-acetyltransferase [Sphingomonadaceae]AMK24316.1 putative acetyltransferase [Sphingobium sp. TKS]NML90391.1 N-acetyltransferase [Sphingobium sp. TB-6]
MTIVIRPARIADAASIAAIYAYHVLHGTATYETVPPSVADTEAKIRNLAGRGWPFLVAYINAEVVGYCYATQFRDRPAYAFACEDSIYVAHDRLGAGIGRALLRALIDAATISGFRQMVAVVGGAEPASVALHASCGFHQVGRLAAMGWKAGKWLDTVYMQIALGDGSTTPPPSA